jgi:RNA polymerase sigma-70 factor (ECF subfamily)
VNAPGEEVEVSLSFEAAFHLHYERIARVIARLVVDRACAEELAVDVFWAYWQNPRVRGENAGGWLYRTAVNRGLHELRRRARHVRYERFFQRNSSPSTPEQIHASSEEQENVRRVLARIRPREAELLLLRGNGFSYEELASTMKLNPASVGTLLRRAQETFRKEYTKTYGEPRNQD